MKSSEQCAHFSELRVRTGSPVDVRQLKVSSSSAQLATSAWQENNKHQHTMDLHNPTEAHTQEPFGPEYIITSPVSAVLGLDDLQKLKIAIVLIRQISLGRASGTAILSAWIYRPLLGDSLRWPAGLQAKRKLNVICNFLVG